MKTSLNFLTSKKLDKKKKKTFHFIVETYIRYSLDSGEKSVCTILPFLRFQNDCDARCYNQLGPLHTSRKFQVAVA